MKTKYLLTAAIATLGLLSSCNMDLPPVGSIDSETALENVNDALSLRNGLYASSRAVTSSAFFSYADIQCDMFNGLTVNGNRLGPIANGNIYSNNSEPEGYWGSMWSLVGDCNYFLERAPKVYEKYLNENEQYNADCVALYIAEAYFFRGYFYSLMFDRWCVVYSPEIADKPGMGLPIVTKFDPTPNRSQYPPRASMKETLDFFLGDLDLAYNGIKAWEEKYPASAGGNSNADGRLNPNTPYISSWCIKALQARVALWLKDYEKAKNLAQEVIGCGIYSLATLKTYENMWKSDLSTENIYLPFESINELGGAIGSVWLNNTNNADYIPSSKVILALQAGGVEKDAFGKVRGYRDIRYNAFIGEREVKSEFGNVKSPVFTKFPGNPSLQTGQGGSNYVNRPKPFRLSEMYFILAESAYELGDETLANQTLEKYMANRINYAKGDGYTQLSGTALRDEIRTQRGLEFMGEGFRLSDLRRWEQGFRRTAGIDYASIGYPSVNSILTRAGYEVVYFDDDHRYTWPIPSSELQVNPQMAGQQNPGY